MATAYNLRNKMYASGSAGRASRLDPGSAGTLVVTPVDRATCVLSGAGARTLEAAAGVPVGTSILCMSQTNAITVNGMTINSGEYVEFTVTKDSSGANQWAVKTTSTFPVNIGAYELAAINTAADNAIALLQLVNALAAVGVVTPAWTQGV